MSEFSGKCDLYDTVEMIGCDNDETKIEDYLKNTTFYMYINDRKVKLKIDSRKELALYYPYLVSSMASSNDKRTIFLSSDSFIDQEEQERLQINLEYILKIYRKYKREKKDFDTKEVLEQLSNPWKAPDYEVELLNRVAEHGMKANIEGLHTSMHEYYRGRWYKRLIELGWPEDEAFCWVYKEWIAIEERKNARKSDLEGE